MKRTPPVSRDARARLIDAARAAVRHAYAPYSRYRVGAAVLAEDGRVFTGVNVENAGGGGIVMNSVLLVSSKGAIDVCFS